MKKTILSVMLLLTCISYADVKNLDATYSVSYGLFGKLGISEAHLDTDGTRYSIEVSAKNNRYRKTTKSKSAGALYQPGACGGWDACIR